MFLQIQQISTFSIYKSSTVDHKALGSIIDLADAEETSRVQKDSEKKKYTNI